MNKRVLFLANKLAQGTGPFQRYEALNQLFGKELYQWLSIDQSTEKVRDEAAKLGSRNINNIFAYDNHNFFGIIQQSYNFCKKNQINIIFAIHTRAILVALIISYLSRRKIKVVAFEGTLFSRYRFLPNLLRKMQNFTCNATICVAEHVKIANSVRGFGSERRFVIHNGISEDSYDLAKVKSKITGNIVNIVFIADLKSHKRPLDFIEIVSRLHRNGYKFMAHVFGDGPCLTDVINAISENKARLPVTIHGYVDRKTIRAFLSKNTGCGLICSELEGLSEVAVQFSYHKWPVVCTKIPGNVEFFGHYGSYFDVGALDQAYEKLETFLERKDLLTLQTAVMSQKVEAEFSLHYIAKEYNKVFENVS